MHRAALRTCDALLCEYFLPLFRGQERHHVDWHVVPGPLQIVAGVVDGVADGVADEASGSVHPGFFLVGVLSSSFSWEVDQGGRSSSQST